MNKISRKYVTLAILFLLIGIIACGTPTPTDDFPEPEPVVTEESPSITQSEEEPVPTTVTPIDTPTPSDTPTPEPTEPSSMPPFEEWIKTSEILLYEQITGDFYRDRWIKLALDTLDLPYVDTGNSNANFHYELTDKKVWDLVIYSREDKNNTNGNQISIVLAEFEDGASVIMEHWNLDYRLDSTWDLTLFFEKTGIGLRSDLRGDFEKILYTYNRDHPIHQQPYKEIRLTAINKNEDERWHHGDYGDLIKVYPEGKCIVLFGIVASDDDNSGTLISCYDNRFILQTFPTHQFERLRTVHLWENYIYNALYARYQYLSKNTE